METPTETSIESGLQQVSLDEVNADSKYGKLKRNQYFM